MLAALAAAPFLLERLGAERLGVLSLIWVFVGYFSFLDLGLGRAITVAVAAARHGSQPSNTEEIRITGSAVVALLVFGSAGAVLVGLLACFGPLPLRLSGQELEREVRDALIWMVPSLPLLLVSSALRGHLEGVGAFRAVNLVRIPAGVSLALAPLVATVFSTHLAWSAVSLFGVRVGQVVALVAVLALQQQRSFMGTGVELFSGIDRQRLTRLLAFGSWMTVSSVLGPVIVYADRFVIGAVVSASAVSVYAIPFDLVSRFPVVVASACGVLLPELVRVSADLARTKVNAANWQGLLSRASWLALGVVGMGTLFGLGLLPAFMNWWVGAEFAAGATPIAQVLLLAFAVNALAQIPYTGLVALGKTKAIATIHLAEALPYVACLWWAVQCYGVMGAAIACVARALVDYALLVLVCRRMANQSANRATP